MAVNKKADPVRHPGLPKKNLLDNKMIKAMLKSRWFPGIIQWPVLFVFALIVFELMAGPGSAHDNFGTAGTWVLWWPLIPIIFLLLGRFWCAICPFATVSDWIQKFVGNNRPVPKFLKKYGIWLIDIFFILITWADHTFGVVENPRGSGVLLLIITTGVIISGAFFERRTWCRYLCFLGGLSGNYARSGSLELHATPEKCAQCTTQSCYKGNGKVAGCPMFEFPRTMDSMARCNLCANCIKTCPNDSIQLSTRVPTKGLWFIKKPKFEESFLAIIIMGIVFVQNITMLEVWEKMLASLENFVGTDNYFVTFTITFIIAMAIPVFALFASSYFAKLSNKKSTIQNFAIFGYSLIPLDLAGHIAHNLFHLLAEGKSIIFTFLALFGVETHGASAAIFSNSTIQILQFGLIGLGTLGSIYTAYRISKYNFAAEGKTFASFMPFAVLSVILGIVNVGLFILPMAMRM
ncbi:4Fe-4S binding protein [Desulfitobacterium hafniense]|nr:4Fe-4S binding protein [Desulfitobacterium hafniense]MEA5025607.1 4Fe-4S binding protein [Desulfitobacterium hafniense]CDX01379.1 4Fe-4S ferredoxin iron-sulfur binding domain-containing protein [Desulfitobacterium hafniense]